MRTSIPAPSGPAAIHSAPVRARRLLFALTLGFLLPAWGSPLQAQTVVGQLLDKDTREGVEGALVLLLNEAGEEVGGVLTNEAGRFRIQAETQGSYSLRVERIGYETVTSEVLRLGSAQLSGVLLETTRSAIELEELRVEGDRQYVIRPAEGLELARVWDEARKALTVQEWAEGQDLYRYQLVRYQRALDPESGAVRTEERGGMEVFNRNPIRSLPARELLEEGFIRTAEDGSNTYYGPDASVLLSDHFLDTHCFRLRTSPDSPDLVGLSFEPVHQRSVPDILGTLWLDRATAELVRLDYSYDWAPWEEVRGVANGRVEFQKMPSGAWIVRKWWIRMPAIGQVREQSNRGWPVLKLMEIREVGSEVAEVTSLDDRVVSRDHRQPKGALRGLAWDSLRSRPLSEVTVFLSGTSYDAWTDSDGRFFMDGIPEGQYSAALTHPSLDSLGIVPPRVDVRINAGDTAVVRLGLPSRSRFLASECGSGEWQVGDAFVTGTVKLGEAGAPAAGAGVTLAWSRYKLDAGGQRIGGVTREIRTTTDARGRYRACGIPPGVGNTVQARLGDSGDGGLPLEMEAAEGAVIILDLILPN